MDINQKLWKRKIAKIKRRKNEVLKLKRKFKKMKENEIRSDKIETKISPSVPSVEAELVQKKFKFYDELFKEGKHQIEEENEVPRVQRRDMQKKLDPTAKDQINKAKTDRKKIYAEVEKKTADELKRQKKKGHLSFYEEKLETKQARKDAANENERKEKEKSEQEKLKEKKLKKKAFTEKTKRGQPLMKNYINLLLNKIQKSK